MKLDMIPPKGLDITDFIKNYRLFQFPEVYINSVDRYRLVRFDDYLNSMNISTMTKTGKKRKISTYDALYSAFSNLVLDENEGTYTLTINPNTTVANFDIKVLTVAELVNYGTISVRPYPIVDDVFDEVADKLGDYYSDYLSSKQKGKNGNKVL